MPINVVNQPTAQTTGPSVGEHVAPDGPITDRRLTRADVPDEWVAPIFEAQNFIIEGPASVEIVDRSGLQIQMDAVADALARFLDSEREPGIISVEHDDVPVGVPIREWTTDDSVRYETTVDDDEFTLVANLGNETTKSKLARARCLNGDYGGYSVTVYSNQEHRRPDGTRVTVDCDLHAVTLGSAEKVMNPAADFDVVDFKAGDHLQAAIRRRLRWRSSLAGTVAQKLRADATGTDFSATVFEVRRGPDDDRDDLPDLLGVGIDFPNADAYVDWNTAAWPADEQLDDPHVSIYGSTADLEQATGNVVEPVGTVAPRVDRKQYPDTFPFAGVAECIDHVERDDEFDVDDENAFCSEWVREVKGEEPAADQDLLRRDILDRLG